MAIILEGAEIARIGEPDFTGNVIDRLVRISQQFYGLFYTNSVDVIVHTDRKSVV